MVYCGSGGIASHILDLDTRWRWVVNFTTGRFTPRERSPGTHWIRDSGPQSRSGRCGEEKNSQLLPGLEASINQPVAQRYTTELSRLLPNMMGVQKTAIHS
jgi:hypothetical protein